MKQLKREALFEYSYLSDLKINKEKDKLVFIETKADVNKNDYVQYLHVLDTEKQTDVVIKKDKRTANFMIEDILYCIEKDEKDTSVHTVIKMMDLEGKDLGSFKLPCALSSLRDFDEENFLAAISIDRNFSNYHHSTEAERKAVDEKKKADEDYVVFDEYPFFFNGAGIINGQRNMLALINKKTHAITDLTSATMDVESFDVEGREIIYSGTDFDTFKGKWSWVYRVNADTLKTEVLYNEVMQISRVFVYQKKIMVIGTFAEEYGAMEAGQFYELKDGKMHLVLENEYGFHNSVGSDCRYGKLKNYDKENGEVYFIATEESKAVLLKYDPNGLEYVVDFEGSIDDFALGKECVYGIAMKDQKTQEIVKVAGNEVIFLTSFSKILDDFYVAKPEKLTLKKRTPIDGWVLKPKDFDPDKKYPAILDIHGGPKTAYGELFYHEMQVWANEGYFVMYCNPRGSDGKGNEFADLRKNFGKIDYEDIMDFVDLVLAEYPNIDGDRLGVTGGSYGGYMTNWIIGQTNRFKAAASQRSISNWITEVCASDYGIDFPIEQEFDDLYHCEKELWEMSPLKYANNAQTPTLFIHSTEDYRCPIVEAIQYYTVLKCRGVETRLVGFKGENHELSRGGKPLHRLRRLNEITDWMESHLK